jgi:hypothetical protein
MNDRVALPWLLGFLVVVASCQALDTTASSGSPVKPPEPPGEPKLTTAILPGPPPFGFFDETGTLVTSDDPCEATRAQARKILTNDCAGCHGGRTAGERAGLPPFDFVLDTAQLTTRYTNNTMPPMLFVATGHPEDSRIYQRMRRGEMPPPADTSLPRPTISDLSVLYEWIAHCLGPKGPPGSTGAGGTGGGDDGGATGGAGGAAGTGGDGGNGTGGGPSDDGGGPKYVQHEVNFFGWPDNGGDAIAFPKLHTGAGGIGTYADPVTFASDPMEWAPGTILYVPYIKRYVIMEDACSACTADWASRKYHIHIWLNSDARAATDVTACETSLARMNTNVEIDPPATRPVATVPLFDPNTSTCVSP